MIRLLLMILLVVASLPALADCRVSGTGAAYGSQTSFVINSTVQTTTATLTLDCDSVLNVLNNDFVTLTLTVSPQPPAPAPRSGVAVIPPTAFPFRFAPRAAARPAVSLPLMAATAGPGSRF